MASLLCQGVYAQQLFYDKLSLTSLNVVGSLHKVYKSPLANLLLGSIYFDKFFFVDRTYRRKSFHFAFFLLQVNFLKS